MALAAHRRSVSIAELAGLAGLHPADVLDTLQRLGLLERREGQHAIVAHPAVIRRWVPGPPYIRIKHETSH